MLKKEKKQRMGQITNSMQRLVSALDVFLRAKLTATIFPFGSVPKGVIQTLIRAHAKNVAILELLRQRDNVRVKEFEFPFVPKLGRIRRTTTLTIGGQNLLKETFIEALVNVPVLL